MTAEDLITASIMLMVALCALAVGVLVAMF